MWAWRALEELNREGRTRAVGVSNFYPDRLAGLVAHNEIVPAVNQIETHVFFQRTDDKKPMREYGVQHECWGPLAEGGQGFFENPVLVEIGRAHGKSVAQVALRWLRSSAASSSSPCRCPEHIAENLDVLEFQLTADEMARIATLDTGRSHIFDHHDPEAVKWLGGMRFNTCCTTRVPAHGADSRRQGPVGDDPLATPPGAAQPAGGRGGLDLAQREGEGLLPALDRPLRNGITRRQAPRTPRPSS
ncbi:aldo/keto reductase [Streptomyces cyaneus]|uniref:aldo/keto reductase n=1 Tax=Streptomyces cyaneus TaxID=1904 RepID=UPI00319E1326